MPEAILEPDLPIVDPHHHLWDRVAGQLPPPDPNAQVHPFTKVVSRRPRYLFDELMSDLRSGHNVIATVFVQCGAMYRADAPENLRPVGETEFVNGVAAMTASGIYGKVRACAGIVGHADCTLGEAAVDQALEAHLKVSDRFRGIRHSCSSDPDPGVLGPLARQTPGLYLSDAFRKGYARLAKYGLSFDAWLLEPQLPELVDLAKRHPDIPVVVDHVGTPLGIASYQGKREERFGVWRDNIKKLAELPHVHVKLGGLAMAFCNFPSFMADPPAPSTQLAAEWGPYLETCIEAFGPGRCMFESNFPVDLGSCDYPTLWNAFKVFAKNHSGAEKADLFAGTASRVYRLDLPN
ncbi:MAG TPA: amidohydrolase family protein [Caulobacteraceae bacterium]|nr:amidohydrolase family protein [Caulobacteraceae bacterium]